MLVARDPATGELFDGDEARKRGPVFARSLQCVDDDCGTPLIWKPGHAGKAPHWAHQAVNPGCGGSAMSAKHKLMEDVIARLPLWRVALPEQTLSIPQHPLRTLARRRVDVAARMEVRHGVDALLSVECQHSGTHLGREERRVLDHNIRGLPVLLTVSSSCVQPGTRPGTARVDHWVREWAKRHGRQQFACIDGDGQIWWCWLKPRPQTRTLDVPLQRVALNLGAPSPVDAQWEMGVAFDASTPKHAPGSPSLLLAVFAWVNPTRSTSKSWPLKGDAPVARFQPERVPAAAYLGTPFGENLFGDTPMHCGGF